MKKQQLLLLFGAIVFLMLPACNSGSRGKDKSAKNNSGISSVEGFIVKPSLLIETIDVSGTLIPYEETVLMPEVPGRIVLVNLPEGKFVRKGTLLVKLFDGELQAQLKKSQTQLQLAEQTESRQSELLKVNGISKFDYDQTVFQVNSIKDDIELLKVQIGKTELIAPFDGVIGLKNISVGAQVTTATALATIRMVDRLKMDFSVPEKYSKELVPGKKLTFTVEGDTNNYSATVLATEEGIESQTRNLKVRSEVDHPGSDLKPGSFAKVELELGRNDHALMIPTQAIIPQARSKKLIVAQDGKADFREITTGIRKPSLIEVLDGVQAGDTIVTTGIMFLKPKADLKFSKLIK